MSNTNKFKFQNILFVQKDKMGKAQVTEVFFDLQSCTIQKKKKFPLLNEILVLKSKGVNFLCP